VHGGKLEMLSEVYMDFLLLQIPTVMPVEVDQAMTDFYLLLSAAVFVMLSVLGWIGLMKLARALFN